MCRKVVPENEMIRAEEQMEAERNGVVAESLVVDVSALGDHQ